LIATWNNPLAVVQDRVSKALDQLRCEEFNGRLKRKDLDAEDMKHCREMWALEDQYQASRAAWKERQRLV
jgi:hypothetical protein